MKIEASGITVRFGRNVALDNAEHVFDEGKIHCLMGPNGCGKTTLIKALVDKYASSGEVAYVAQDTFGQLALTVYDIVALGRYDRSKFFTGATQDDREKIEHALEVMELQDMKERMFDTLSGGEKQRAMVARAICQETAWMLLDEPASNLDVFHTRHIMETFAGLKCAANMSFIIVVHDINVASKYADSCVLMKSGKIVAVRDELDRQLLSEIYDIPFGESVTSTGQQIFYPE